MPKYKYNEEKLLQELKDYIDKTYNEHYVGENEIQSIDSIMAAGHGQGFFVGNVQKYAARYGKKKGTARADLLKILHYALLQLNLHDKEEKKKLPDYSTIRGNFTVEGQKYEKEPSLYQVMPNITGGLK